MNSNKYFSVSAQETESIGRNIAQKIPPQSIVCLTGDLGAGKTTLSKGLASEITGVSPHNVVSPTFTYLNVYQGHQPLYHFDCYRLSGSEDFLERGFDEYFEELCLIEWPEKIEAALPKNLILITIKYDGQDKRIIYYERH